MNAIQHCKDLVKLYDPTAALVTRFLPTPLQPHYTAIRAFNIELALVKQRTQNEAIAALRWQFWRDSVQAIYDDRHVTQPTALCMSHAHKEVRMPKDLLQSMIDGHEADQKQAITTQASLQKYSRATHGAVSLLTAHLLNPHPVKDISDASNHLGEAIGIALSIKAHPALVRQGQCALPLEWLEDVGLTPLQVMNLPPTTDVHQGLLKVVQRAVGYLDDHLKSCSDIVQTLPKAFLPVFLPAVALKSFVKVLRSVEYNPHHPAIQAPDWKLPWALYMAYLRSRID